MGDTQIEWTDKTWNPTVGCTRVSEGCRNCYAFSLHDMRHQAWKDGWKNAPKQYHQPFKVLQLLPDRLDDPLHWRAPARVFVNSMSDLFHKDVPFEFIDKVFAVMALCPQHTFQVLTKRPERMAEYLNHTRLAADDKTRFDREWLVSSVGWGMFKRPIEISQWPLPNVCLGTSVENRETADVRIPHLKACPAAVRFLSCEPLLGKLDLRSGIYAVGENLLRGTSLEGIGWAIVGVESDGKRVSRLGDFKSDEEWLNAARFIRDQCRSAGVAFFQKQLPIRGRVSHDPAEWPEDMKNCREWPKEAAHAGN